jgi:hypothetical protein
MRLFLFFFLFPLLVISQKSNSDSTFEYTYFKNGKISTKRLRLSDKIRFGYLKAFKVDGNEIYSMSTRIVGGHASVYVEFYPSGAIKKAHATDQPDGGIQYGDVTHYFDEIGNVTSVVDLSDDGWGRTVTYPDFRKVDSPVVTPKIDKKPEVVSCATIYSSEIYVVNFTRKPQTIISNKTPPNGIGFKEKTILNPGDTVLLGGYYEAQLFTPATTVYSAEVELTKQNKKSSFHFVWDNFTQPTPALRKHYLLLIDKKVK